MSDCVLALSFGVSIDKGDSGNMMSACVPIWMTEIVPPKNRGALVDLHGACYLSGYMIAAWVGLGFYFLTPHSSETWRGPFGESLRLHDIQRPARA